MTLPDQARPPNGTRDLIERVAAEELGAFTVEQVEGPRWRVTSGEVSHDIVIVELAEEEHVVATEELLRAGLRAMGKLGKPEGT